MNPALIVKLRPAGAWRSGPDSGARNRVDPIYHSDSLYAAVTGALAALHSRDEWLDATARHPDAPAVRFSSCFPFAAETSFIIPPRSIWPPPAATVGAGQVRWRSARFVPLALVKSLVEGQPLHEDQWTVDGASECLLPAGQPGPFRTQVRSNAVVDRLTGNGERHATACIQFRANAGLWAIVSFADDSARERWDAALRGAFRFLADSGFGGERSRGWGRCAEPEFIDGTLPGLVLPPQEHAESETARPESEHWLLSLFTPGPRDTVDWQRGNYTLVARGGRIAGAAERKKELQMVTEGSVLVAQEAVYGSAPDVAPDGFAHPVFRAGFALSIPLPLPQPQPAPAPVEVTA